MVATPRRIGVLGGQGVEAFAQHSLDRILPTGSNVQRFPERKTLIKVVSVQPVGELAAALHTLLQLLKRGTARVCFGAFLLNVLHVGENGAARLLEARQLLLLLHLIFLRLGNTLAQLKERFLLEFVLSAVRFRQGLALLRQPLATTDDDLQRTLGVTTVCLFDLQALIRLRLPPGRSTARTV